MDDDEDYQRMGDYENEIYDLNHAENQSSDDDSSTDQPIKVAPRKILMRMSLTSLLLHPARKYSRLNGPVAQ